MRTLPIQGADREAVVATLKASGWFRALQERAEAETSGKSGLEQIIAAADLVAYGKGETILEEGFPSDSFYLLVSGRVQVGVARGARVGLLKPPASFGEVGLLLDEPRTASVTAEDEVRALRFGARAFHEVFEKIPEFGLDTSRYLARRLRDVTSLIAGPRSATSEAPAAEEAPKETPQRREEIVAKNEPLLPFDAEDSFL